MGKKIIFFLFVVLIAGFLGAISMYVFLHPARGLHSPFFLGESYAQKLEQKLTHLLEPVTGVGNVRASVQAEVRHQDTTRTVFDFNQSSRTVTREKGPVLVAQSVSVLVNEKGKKQLPLYEKLVKSAIGFNPVRGDTLTIESMPFIKVPLWTFGLTALCLVRIGAVLILLILIGVFWLIKEMLVQQKSIPLSIPSDAGLWQKIESIPASLLTKILKTKRPETTALILNQLTQNKAAEIIELLPSDYMKRVILHLNYIEKLSLTEKSVLLKETEKQLFNILRVAEYEEKPASNRAFEELKNAADKDLQNLLHYVGKRDLIMALQTASLATQQAFARNIPPALWQEIIYQTQLNPCKDFESKKAQEKIIHIDTVLKEKI